MNQKFADLTQIKKSNKFKEAFEFSSKFFSNSFVSFYKFHLNKQNLCISNEDNSVTEKYKYQFQLEYGFICTKKVGSAKVRNRCKRIFKNVIKDLFLILNLVIYSCKIKGRNDKKQLREEIIKKYHHIDEASLETYINISQRIVQISKNTSLSSVFIIKNNIYKQHLSMCAADICRFLNIALKKNN